MSPNTFLSLVQNLSKEDQRGGSISYLESVAKTIGWGPPILYVNFDSRIVEGREGRHRTIMFKKLCGDKPYLVHVKLNGESSNYRARNLTRQMLEDLNNGLYRESTGFKQGEFVPGPLFSKIYLLNQEVNF